jgi:hypothetical protein
VPVDADLDLVPRIGNRSSDRNTISTSELGLLSALWTVRFRREQALVVEI